MTPEELKYRGFEQEFVYAASRSGGPGGQNVNKVNTKVELRINISNSSLFSAEEKEIIFRKLKNKINITGELIIVSQDERSQLLNKTSVTEKFYLLVSKALTAPKNRRSTRPTLSSKIKRLDEKKSRGTIKKLRNTKGNSEE